MPIDVICDLLLSERLGVNQVTSGPWIETMRPFITHPHGMVGTDSTFIGAKPSPRTYGSFPRILGQFVRDEALMGLEEAIRKMTSAPAARLGLRERGTLRDGALADVVVFDPATIRSTATYDEPRSYPVGISHVIVNGVLVVDDGAHTRRHAGSRDPPGPGLGPRGGTSCRTRVPCPRSAPPTRRRDRRDRHWSRAGSPRTSGQSRALGLAREASPALAQPMASRSDTAPDSSHRSHARRMRST